MNQEPILGRDWIREGKRIVLVKYSDCDVKWQNSGNECSDWLSDWQDRWEQASGPIFAAKNISGLYLYLVRKWKYGNIRLRSSGAGAVLVKIGKLVQCVQVGNGGGLVGLVLVSDEGIKVGLSGGGTHRVKIPLPGSDGLGDVGKRASMAAAMRALGLAETIWA